MKPLPYWKRVAHDRWVVEGSPYALSYCQTNCHYVAYRGGEPLFQVLTLEEATETLDDLVLVDEYAEKRL